MNAIILDWGNSFLMMILGFILYKLLSFTKRTKKQTKFNIFYWWKDNRNEIFIILILFTILNLYFDDINHFLQFQFGFIMILKKGFLMFLLGLFFATILHKLRKLLKLEYPMYPDGTIKLKSKNDENDFVGERPDDR